jgi:hypothetical protein
VPGKAIPTIPAFGRFDVTYFWMSFASSGSSLIEPSASSGRVFRMPNALIVAEPASDSSGKVIPRCLLNAARISGGS